MHTHRVEILESRIAPAVFFLSGTDLSVKNSTGGDVAGDTAAATTVGATKAVPLNAGDSVVYDLNGNHVMDAADFTMVKVKAGKALAFFTDTNTASGQTARFDANEFTGLAVGDGVKAKITGDLHGSIDTLLNASGVFSTVRQAASIAGLKITGVVDGNIQAGGSITNVTFTAPDIGAAILDVNAIVTGSAALNTPTFNAGGKNTALTFTQAAGTDAGDITDIKLNRGVHHIQAGNGGDNSLLNGGNGGNLTKLNISGTIVAGVSAGMGGNATSIIGKGGEGGAVSKSTFTITRDSNNSLAVSAGTGGGGGTQGNGGAGGGFSDITLRTTVYHSGSIDLITGSGGNASSIGDGGAGGAISNTIIDTKAWVGGSIQLLAGLGGNGSGGGKGGNGGAVSLGSILSVGANNTTSITAGKGGSGDGDGGSISQAAIKIIGNGGGGVSITAGDGGNGAGYGAVVNRGANGGGGGAVDRGSIEALGYANGQLQILGGDGGSGGTASGNGGNGGAVSDARVKSMGAKGTLRFYGGEGGAGGGNGGNGGQGGDLTKLTVTSLGFLHDRATMGAGYGGNTHGISGDGGDSGRTKGVTITNKGGMSGLGIYSANGGNSGSTTGNGGNSGSLSHVTVNNLANITDSIFIGSFYGGDATGTAGNGGDAGNTKDVTVTDLVGTTAAWHIYAGAGGKGKGAGGKGGNGGNLKTVTFDGSADIVDFGYVDFEYVDNSKGNGGTGPDSAGGNGGSIFDIRGTAARLLVVAQKGGNAGGNGGTGGSITSVDFNVSQFARIITAGDGGGVATGGSAGEGGSITNVRITGTGVIGDFTTAFSVDGDFDTGMGGLIAGQGGAINGVLGLPLNGSITNVTATRIAAIVAGALAGNAVSAANAVSSIAGLNVAIVGADVNGNRAFDFIENTATTAGYQLNGAADPDDMPIDGLVIVKAGGFTPSSKTKFLLPAIFV